MDEFNYMKLAEARLRGTSNLRTIAGKHRDAIERFEAILREAPDWDYGNAAHELAQCYAELSNFAAAKQYYQNALSHWPDQRLH